MKDLSSSIDEVTQNLLFRGKRLVKLLIQSVFNPIFISNQILSLFLGIFGYLDSFSIKFVSVFENIIHSFVTNSELFIDRVRSLVVNCNFYQINCIMFFISTYMQNILYYFNNYKC